MNESSIKWRAAVDPYCN